jgi:D-alanyl-D-alanine carboxypeptidase (penicillin-binding protein 5/6)
MRRTVIITLVALLHIALLIWIIGLTRDTAPAPPETRPGTPPEIPELHQPGDTTAVASAPPSPPTGSGALARLDKLQFTAAASSQVPADLAARLKACKSGVLIDWSRKHILWQKDSERAVPIASMTKMMSVLLLMEAIERDPMLSLETPVKVTRTAAKIGGRQVWLDPRETFSLDELLKCIMIRSANDATYLIAEFVSNGDVKAFVSDMNKRASALGLRSAQFCNPHGLPPDGNARPNQASPLEMAFLAARLLEYPEVVKWSSTRLAFIRENDPRFERFQLVSSNRLVGNVEGVNGMKTGYTENAGYCTTVTCQRQGRTVIAVVTGCNSYKERDSLVKAMLDWAYAR